MTKTPETCAHLDTVRVVQPSARGCEECLRSARPGCICDGVPQLRPCRLLRLFSERHATKHFQATRHPIIEGYDPPEGWGWCYLDEVFLDLSCVDNLLIY